MSRTLHPALLAALAVLALVVCASPARAASHPADGQLWSAAKVAGAYWDARAAAVREAIAARGGTAATCELVTPSIASPPVAPSYVDGEVRAAKAYGWAATGSCAFALTPRYAAKTRGRRGWWTRLDLRNECATVVHEYGHALGLEHEDAGRFPVMAQGELWNEDLPRECSVWAKRIMREWRAGRRAARR
jgi:hypothetical protein